MLDLRPLWLAIALSGCSATPSHDPGTRLPAVVVAPVLISPEPPALRVAEDQIFAYFRQVRLPLDTAVLVGQRGIVRALLRHLRDANKLGGAYPPPISRELRRRDWHDYSVMVYTPWKPDRPGSALYLLLGQRIGFGEFTLGLTRLYLPRGLMIEMAVLSHQDGSTEVLGTGPPTSR